MRDGEERSEEQKVVNYCAVVVYGRRFAPRLASPHCRYYLPVTPVHNSYFSLTRPRPKLTSFAVPLILQPPGSYRELFAATKPSPSWLRSSTRINRMRSVFTKNASARRNGPKKWQNSLRGTEPNSLHTRRSKVRRSEERSEKQLNHIVKVSTPSLTAPHLLSPPSPAHLAWEKKKAKIAKARKQKLQQEEEQVRWDEERRMKKENCKPPIATFTSITKLKLASLIPETLEGGAGQARTRKQYPSLQEANRSEREGEEEEAEKATANARQAGPGEGGEPCLDNTHEAGHGDREAIGHFLLRACPCSEEETQSA